MASTVDICNAALGYLGDRANVSSIDPPEGSAQADHCARFYPIARDTALQDHPWPFATSRVALASMESGVAGWQYAYAEPTDCLRLLEVMPDADMFGARSIMFDRETDALTGLPIILTNTDQAVIRYTRRITDTSRFSPLFTDALTWLLASKLAGPVLKGQTGAAAATRCYTAYEKLISKAATIDANQTTRRQSFVPSSVAARGGIGRGTHSFGPYQAYRSEDLTTYPDGLPRLD